MVKTDKLADFEDKLNWEDKALQNPLYAIMSHKEYEDAQSVPTAEQLEVFYQKGVNLWNRYFRGVFEGLPANAVILEYGCGMGRILTQPARLGRHCYGVDISPTQLKLARQHMSGQEHADFLLLENQRNIPLPDNSVDYAYSFSVLQHIKNTADLFFAIGEIIRVTKPGGFLKIHVPYLDGYFDTRYAILRRWNFQESSILFYLHKKYFNLPESVKLPTPIGEVLRTTFP